MLSGLLNIHPDLETGHILALLLKDGDHVHPRAPGQTDPDQLQRAESVTATAHGWASAHVYFETRAGGTSK
jgi:hypothetical protein